MPRPGAAGGSLGAWAAVAGLLAFILVLVLNGPPGHPGIHSDSVEYLAAAASLARDGSFQIPVTHWSNPDSSTVLSHYPPLFSLATAASARISGARVEVAVVWVMALGMGLLTALAVALGTTLGGRLSGILAAVLVVTTPAITVLFMIVWSETLFFPVVLAGLFAVWRYPNRSFVHGVIAAVAVAIRYVGFSLTATAAWYAWRSARDLPDRVRRIALAGVPSVGVFLAWGWYVGEQGEAVRSAGWYPGVGSQSLEFLLLLIDWLVPVYLRSPGVLEATLALTVAGLLSAILFARLGHPAAVSTHTADDEQSANLAGFGRTVGVFSAATLGVTVASRAILDPLIPFNTRLFGAVLLAITILFSASLVRVLGRAGRSSRLVLAAAVAAWIGAGILEIGEVARDGRSYYSDDAWDEDAALAWIGEYGLAYPHIYSNEAALIVYRVGRPAKHLVREGEDLARFREAFLLRPGPVLLTTIDMKKTPDRNLLIDLLNLESVRQTPNAELLLPAGDAVARSRLDPRRIAETGLPNPEPTP